jgi:hypothetical protein
LPVQDQAKEVVAVMAVMAVEFILHEFVCPFQAPEKFLLVKMILPAD